MANYQTGLASEFYILSALYRLGLDANMTIGNRKAVDIILVNSRGATITIDVKETVGKTGWFIDNVKLKTENHFLIFVCYVDRMIDLSKSPEIYIVPSMDIDELVHTAQPSGRRLIKYRELRDKSNSRYANAWHQIVNFDLISSQL